MYIKGKRNSEPARRKSYTAGQREAKKKSAQQRKSSKEKFSREMK